MVIEVTDHNFEEEMDDLPDSETEELEDQVVGLASNARTIAELVKGEKSE